MQSRSLLVVIAGIGVYGVTLVAHVLRAEPWPHRLALFLMLVLPCAFGGAAVVLAEREKLYGSKRARMARIFSGTLITVSVLTYFVMWATEAFHRNLPRLH